MKDVDIFENKRSAMQTAYGSRDNASRLHSTRDSATRSSSQFVPGEEVPRSALTSLSALYQSTFKRYPTFPSIYESKYQHDFRHIPWQVERVKREYTAPPNYKNFKFGSTSYSEQFQILKPMKNEPITPISRHRRHNPHPSIRNVQNYPNQVRWIWSDAGMKKNHSKDGYCHSAENPGSSKWRQSPQPRWHRWNSR